MKFFEFLKMPSTKNKEKKKGAVDESISEDATTDMKEPSEAIEATETSLSKVEVTPQESANQDGDNPEK